MTTKEQCECGSVCECRDYTPVIIYRDDGLFFVPGPKGSFALCADIVGANGWAEYWRKQREAVGS